MTEVLVIHPTPMLILEALTPYADKLTWHVFSTYEEIQDAFAQQFELIIAYHAPPKHDAKILLQRLARLSRLPAVVIVADAPNEQETVALMRRGVLDFISNDYVSRLDKYLRDISTIPLMESQLWTLFDDALDIIMIVDVNNGKILSVNQTITRLLGYTRDLVLDQHFSMLFPKNSPYSLENSHQEIIINDAVIESQPFLRKDHTICRMDITVKQVVWDSQPVVLMTMRDVTERYETMQALHTAQAQLKTILHNAPIVLWAINIDGEFTLYAGQGTEQFGQAPETIIGKSAFDIYAHLPNGLDDLRRALSGESFLATYAINDVVLDTYFNPFTNNAGEVIGVIGASIDVTEQAHAKQALFEVKQERESIGFREEFLSMISHQFRTPLTVILTSTQMLDQYFDMLTPERRLAHLSRIENQAYYINDLLDDIIEIRALQTTPEIKSEPINIALFANDIAQQVGLNNGDNTRVFTADYNHVETVYFDPKLLRHIIEELLTNAQKYTSRDGEISLDVTITNNVMRLSVHDNGMGILPDDMNTLFEMFTRGGNVKRIQGTGLGLALVKLCVDTYNGTIDVESIINQGTTFTVTLPCV